MGSDRLTTYQTRLRFYFRGTGNGGAAGFTGEIYQRHHRNYSMLIIVPITVRQANALVARWHRHHKPVRGHRFSLGAYNTETRKLVGAAIVGRPVARYVNWYSTVEVNRLVTDGTRNACSILYAASARVAREMGFEMIQTYILESETGVSLRASGWYLEEVVRGGQWHHTDSDRPRRIRSAHMRQAAMGKETEPITTEFLAGCGTLSVIP